MKRTIKAITDEIIMVQPSIVNESNVVVLREDTSDYSVQHLNV